MEVVILTLSKCPLKYLSASSGWYREIAALAQLLWDYFPFIIIYSNTDRGHGMALHCGTK